jgi:hypothetical protein
VPFKSQAQRRKFAQLLVDGKISADTFEEWNRETGAKKLPERAGKKAARPRKRRAAAKRARPAKGGSRTKRARPTERARPIKRARTRGK